MKKAVNDKRPVNLDIASMKLPITAYVSILHRVSGVVIFVGVAILLCMLGTSLESAEGFAEVQASMDSFFAKLIVWGVLSGLIYHTVAGVKHLIMDLGIGETLEGGVMGAKLVLAISVVLIVLAGLWIW